MSNRTFPEKAIIVTEKATFHITITSFKNRDTNRIEHYTLSIGSRKSKCVQINIPSIESGKKEGTLIWVEKVDSACYLDARDEKSLSQLAVNLGFTIARDINPTCNRYIFDDCSSFKCILPEGQTETLSMKPFHIAFHGSTWYEKYFGAKLVKDHQVYERLKLNLYDSAKKPKIFNFSHEDLDIELRPIYESSHTWNDFFQAIQKKYADKKCAVLYPWIIDAMLEIFDNNYIFENPKWYIDLEENAKNIKTPFIQFYSYKDALTSGGGITRKNKKAVYNKPPIYIRNRMKIQAMDYKNFLQSYSK